MHIENVQKIQQLAPQWETLAAVAAAVALNGPADENKTKPEPSSPGDIVAAASSAASKKSGSVCILISHFACTRATHLLFTSQQQATLRLSNSATQYSRLMPQLSTAATENLPPIIPSPLLFQPHVAYHLVLTVRQQQQRLHQRLQTAGAR